MVAACPARQVLILPVAHRQPERIDGHNATRQRWGRNYVRGYQVEIACSQGPFGVLVGYFGPSYGVKLTEEDRSQRHGLNRPAATPD